MQILLAGDGEESQKKQKRKMSAKVKPGRPAQGFGIRHKHLMKKGQNPFKAVTKSAIQRAAHYSGIGYVTQAVQDECRIFLEDTLTGLVTDAFSFTNCGKRITVSDEDVIRAAKRRGLDTYGMQVNDNFKMNALLNMKKKRVVKKEEEAAATVAEEDDDANDGDYDPTATVDAE